MENYSNNYEMWGGRGSSLVVMCHADTNNFEVDTIHAYE